MIYSFRHPKRLKVEADKSHSYGFVMQQTLEALGRKKRQAKYDLESLREPVMSPIEIEPGKITQPLCGSRPHVAGVIAKSIRIARSRQ